MKPLVVALCVAVMLTAAVDARQKEAAATTALAVESWVNAVRTHTPGRPDAAMTVILRLTYSDRFVLNSGMSVLLESLTKKGGSVSKDPSKRIANLGLGLARDPGANAFLERAAMLHSDAAIFGNQSPVAASSAAVALASESAAPSWSGNDTSAPLLFTGHLTLENDGEVIGDTIANWNWVFARSLLDLVAPRHVDDAFVGAWYHATAAFLFRTRRFGELTSHLKDGDRLVGNDARIVFDRASYAEMQGLPHSRQVLSGDVHSLDAANGEAETLFRRVLELDPGFFEARVHLARLFNLRHQYTDALTVLDAAPRESLPTDPVAAFYAELFMTKAERGLGRLADAADRAHDALRLFPDAQSALMASSQIAMLRADEAGAEAPLEHLASLSPDPNERADPWWIYDISLGRNSGALWAAVWAESRARIAASGSR